MLESHATQVHPPRIPAADFTVPEPLDLAFEGWSPEVFAMLDRLRAHPHIEQYRKEKPGVTDLLKEPFKGYRNDLVVNWVLPNRLGLETEKNVFSRLLKNDFGAGGCKDNLWMSFYRPGRKRLEDVQISHKISPDGFAVGLFVGGYAKDLVKQAKERIASEPGRYLGLVNPLLENGAWNFFFRVGAGQSKTMHRFTDPLGAVPEELERAQAIWVRRYFDRDDVLACGPQLVPRALDTVITLWPIYRFYLAGSAT